MHDGVPHHPHPQTSPTPCNQISSSLEIPSSSCSVGESLLCEEASVDVVDDNEYPSDPDEAHELILDTPMDDYAASLQREDQLMTDEQEERGMLFSLLASSVYYD